MATIIVQDNDAATLAILTDILEMEAFTAKTVLGTDQDILLLTEAIKPQLILLDYVLSGEDSISLCKQIKSTHPNIPVIVMSCNLTIGEDYSRYGFDNYLEKPFDVGSLLQLVEAYLK